ncbi:MAG: electron transport complex subunit RsxG [Methylophilaceae bacterium]|nr:electron transport complex subunit RsxG [Methylophilaceae bacterium]MDG1454337.1 electron transport complex subunit RsxG [Methylophilaceae bacterium]
MAETVLKHATKTALTLVAFAFTFTLLMTVVYQITKEPIAKSEAAARIALFQQVIAHDRYDNAVLQDTISIAPSTLLGNKKPTTANIARMNGEPVAVILEAVAHDGYSGDITLLVAVNSDGSLSGVRVIKHTETPGLGDYIDIAKSTWIKLFDNQSLNKTSDANWVVKKDGGAFDYMAGATITPRALVKAVHKALQYFEANKTTLLQVTETAKVAPTEVKLNESI